MKPVHIFILCYNEEKIIEQTITFYRKRFPKCNITIFDNESTDNSVYIAKLLNCNVQSFFSNNTQNDYIFLHLKNNFFKNFINEETWVLIVDMDEWLCIDESILEKEELLGTTILSVRGYDMIGESKNTHLTDIDLHKIDKCIEPFSFHSKNVCFLYPSISDINYTMGAHSCSPKGNVKFSEQYYKLKHMKYLGLEYLIDNNNIRYKRSHKMREEGFCIHYTSDIEYIKNLYNQALNNSIKFIE